MQRKHCDVIRELRERLEDAIKVTNIQSFDMLTVIMPRKDFKLLNMFKLDKCVIKENKVIRYMGINCVKANVDRIYICLR